jgi:two-component system, OmpR family, alkaline phosphatase synthesis response regulator PhoP
MSEKIKILIADDEPDILEFLQYNLEREGYEIILAENGREAITKAKAHNPQMILLDIMMPELDGIETCRELRNLPDFKNTLIAFLTARNEDYSQIAGFDVGADDYITKPIKPRVLISRIKALMRRFGSEVQEENVSLGSIEIDREKYLVYKDGEKLSLPKKEFELLSLLASKPGKVFSRKEIMSKIWGNDIIVGDRTIDVHIRKLREKIGEDQFKTIKGIGYKFDM